MKKPITCQQCTPERRATVRTKAHELWTLLRCTVCGTASMRKES